MTRLYTTLLATLIIFTTGCCDEKGLPNALRDLYSEKASERNKALLLMSKCGDRVESAVPRISQLLYDENVGVASSAAYALRCIDTKNARAALKAAERTLSQRRTRR